MKNSRTSFSAVSCKTRNHPQISQTTHKPAKLPTNHPIHPQTSHKPAKPPTNHSNYPQTTQTIHKPATNQSHHPQSSHNHSIISRKTVFMLPKTSATMQNMCEVCNHAITLTFSSEDQNQVGISRENDLRIFKRQPGKPRILNYSPPSLHFEFFQFFSGKSECKNQEQEQSSRVRRDKLGLPAKGKSRECGVNPF